MLLSFSLQNFRSFKSEQTLNLLASRRVTPHGPPHCVALPNFDTAALRVASLYGANGAGKSNLIRAIGVLKQLILAGTSPGKPIAYQPFLLDQESPTQPSTFELQFLTQEKVFRYGVCCDSKRVHEEWLDVYEDKNERNLFSRRSDDDGSVVVQLGPTGKARGHTQKMKALAEVGSRPNQLFLTEIVNLDDPDAQGPLFHRAVKWFSSTLSVIEPDAPFASLAESISADEAFAKFAGVFLRLASTGISDLEVKTENIGKSSFWQSMLPTLPEGELLVLQGPQGEEIILDRTEADTVRRRTIMALHDRDTGEQVRLPLHEESDGSRRLLNLLPALFRLANQGGVFVIDELERSMHPMLARKFIEYFLQSNGDTRSQLIFTTHESALLDLDLIRRDGIWFAEKDSAGATHLYSLADFKVRKDLRIEKGYLEGRFGAIPFLGGIDRLIEEREIAETTA